MMKCIVTRIPVIQLRFSTIGADGKEAYGWNKKFQRAHVAADHWARHVYNEWRNELVMKIGFAEFQRLGYDDWGYQKTRIKKLVRRSLPIFKRMLK